MDYNTKASEAESGTCGFNCEHCTLNRDQCANCRVFKWNHPPIQALRKCSRCRKMWYCSRECQEEHWVKVHKKHCKFFSGSKNQKDTLVHNEATCIYCQASDGEKVFEQDNPNYICFTSSSKAKQLMMLQRQYPLPLARLQDDRLERIVDVLLRLLIKMDMANNPSLPIPPISHIFPKQFEKLASKLFAMKEEMFVAKVMNPPQMGVSHVTEVSDIMSVVEGGEGDIGLTTFLQCDALQIVQTFLMMLELLFNVAAIQAEGLLKSPEKSLPDDQRTISEGVKKSSFLKKTDQILDALDLQIISHSALAALVCNGSTEKVCSSCGEEIWIGAVWHPGYKLPQAQATVVLCPHRDNIYCCGDEECEKSLVVRGPFQVWTMAVEMTIIKLTETRCDFCFLFAPLQEVHRSLCKTKNYCSKGCRTKDEEVHKVCCKEKTVNERKLKIGGKERVEVASKRLDRMSEAINGSPMYKEVVSKIKAGNSKGDKKGKNKPS